MGTNSERPVALPSAGKRAFDRQGVYNNRRGQHGGLVFIYSFQKCQRRSKQKVSGTLLESVQDAIQRRAYQLFEERDPHDGSDSEDWFRAEDEVPFAAGPLVTLQDDRIDVRVDLGECQLTDLTLGIEPFRLVVSRRTKTEVENENNAFFRLVTLPGEIDPLNSSVTVFDACLCHMPRTQDVYKFILL